MMVVRGSPSFSGVKDVRPALARADLGGSLNTRELMDIAAVLQCARLVRAYLADDSVGRTCIDHLFSALRANKFLEEKINGSIPGEDEIADAASAALSDIRRKMRAAAARAREALQRIISSPSYAKALQEPIITMRSDRYVVPVKADHKGARCRPCARYLRLGHDPFHRAHGRRESQQRAAGAGRQGETGN